MTFSSLKKIIEDLKKLEELTVQCMKCGLCQSVCPLYQKDLLEQSVSRGKISLIESLFEGRIKDTKGVLRYIDYCILCGRCKRYCPSSVKTDEIFINAKSILRRINKLPFYQKFVLKTLIEHPNFIQNVEPAISVGIKVTSPKIKGEIRKIKFPFSKNIESIKSKSFSNSFGGFNKAKHEKMRVIFYVGCAINYIYTNWGKAIVDTLNHFGVSVYVPNINYCCGIPAATMGEIDIYKKMVNKNLDWLESIEDAKYIITTCPTCQWGLFDLGSRILNRTIDSPALDIMVFLDEVLGIQIEPQNTKKSTLHIPCHYDHSKDDSLVEFIKRNISSDFNPLDDQGCCGFGGTFSIKHSKKSQEVGSSKIDEIKREGYKILYTPCPGCAIQLTDLMVENNCDVDVKHPIEDLYESIKGERINE